MRQTRTDPAGKETTMVPHPQQKTEPLEDAIRLLEEWSRDDSGYDERAWPRLMESVETHRLSERKHFCDAPSDAGHLSARPDHPSAPQS